MGRTAHRLQVEHNEMHVCVQGGRSAASFILVHVLPFVVGRQIFGLFVVAMQESLILAARVSAIGSVLVRACSIA